MLSKQAKDPGGLETRTVNLQAPGFFFALYAPVPSAYALVPSAGGAALLQAEGERFERHQMSPRGRTA